MKTAEALQHLLREAGPLGAHITAADDPEAKAHVLTVNGHTARIPWRRTDPETTLRDAHAFVVSIVGNDKMRVRLP